MRVTTSHFLAWVLASFVVVGLSACNDPVATPTNVSAVGGDGEAVISWDDVEGAASFNVYWNSTGKDTDYDSRVESTSTSVVVSGLRNESTYSFRVTAVADGRESAASQVVTARATAARLSSINITPESLQMATGTRQYLKATGSYSDGTTRDISGIVSWRSANPTVATITEDGRGAGRVSAIAAGSVGITATYRGTSGETSITVQTDTLATLIAVNILPSKPFLRSISLDRGARLSFSVVGTFSSGLVQDLTATALWSSGEPAIAIISNSPGSEGVARGFVAGTAAVSAIFDQGNGIHIGTGTTLTVIDHDVVALAIVAARDSIVEGEILDLTGQATFSDGSTATVTDSLIWRSDNTGVLQVGPPLGRLTGIKSGTANVTIELPGYALSAAKGFTVSPPTGNVVDHTEFVAGCVDCHNGFAGSGKQGKHLWGLATSDVCEACHAKYPAHWAPILKFDHAQTNVANCATCHNDSLVRGKGATHIQSSNDCAACHTTTAWSAATLDHAQLTGSCASATCHSALPVAHIPIASPFQCDACHLVPPAAWPPPSAWAPVKIVDHTQVLGACPNCHMFAGKHNLGMWTSTNCGACHSVPPDSFVSPLTFDHAETQAPCIMCHNDLLFRGKPATHFVMVDDCGGCHTTTAWVPVTVNHSFVLVGSCDVCHFGNGL